MATTFDEIYERFLEKINDADLAELPIENIRYHLKHYLEDAIFTYLHPAPDCLKEMTEEGFETEIPIELQNIVAHAMVLAWLEPKIKYDRLMRSAISGRDYSELSNANQLKALLELQSVTKEKIDEFLSVYAYTHEDFEGFK